MLVSIAGYNGKQHIMQKMHTEAGVEDFIFTSLCGTYHDKEVKSYFLKYHSTICLSCKKLAVKKNMKFAPKCATGKDKHYPEHFTSNGKPILSFWVEKTK